jgi:hypothetical protein
MAETLQVGTSHQTSRRRCEHVLDCSVTVPSPTKNSCDALHVGAVKAPIVDARISQLHFQR